MRFGSLILVLVSLMTSPAFAMDEGDFRVGLLAGHVGMTKDLQSAYGSSLGYGVNFGYAATDDMIFDLSYIASSAHNNLKHGELNVGLDYYVGGYDALYPQVLAGVSFIGNEISSAGTNLNGSGFGIYAGVGADFEVGPRFLAGLQAKYIKAFETSVSNSAGVSIPAVQDSYTVMLRVLAIFGNNK
jgi:hypothetical protein